MSEELCFSEATVLAADLRAGRVSAREVMEAYLDRIEAINPRVTALVSLRDRDVLMAEAAAADDTHAKHGPAGPLHGIPLAPKDLVDVRGLPTTHGSPTVSTAPVNRDELFVSRLRDAGAIFIGKANTPEFGAGSHTFNPVFGTTLNPFNRERTAGGSSGGGACALAARLLPLADGSDLGGSLRNPAAWNGVVGLRPSVGRVPSVATGAWRLNTIAVSGPMARTVDDLSLLLSVMAGPHPSDPISLREPGALFREPLRDDLDGIRVGWAGDLGVPFEAEALAVPEKAVQRFDAAGGSVEVDQPDLAGAEEAFVTCRALIYREVGDAMGRDNWAGLKDTLRGNIELGHQLTVEQVLNADRIRTRLHETMTGYFEKYDVMALPTTQVTPFTIDVEFPTEINGVPMKNYIEWMASCWMITITGCPAISVPAGFDSNGCPLGLQLVAPIGEERRLLEIAKGFEAATSDLRRTPTILPA